MAKIVFNACFGGFSLSYAAVMRYAEIKGIKIYGFTTESGNWRTLVPVDSSKLSERYTTIIYCTTETHDDGSYWSEDAIDRADPALVQVIEEMGDKANGMCAKLCIAEVPSGTQYRIDEYDGRESIATRDSYEWKTA